MIKIAICDDEVLTASKIETFITELAEIYGLRIDIDVYYDGSTLVEAIRKQEKYDLIYLDVVMKHKNGVDAAHDIREVDTSVFIIYITSHESFAKEVFEVSAYRFITKPLDEKIFEKYFLNVIKEIQKAPIYFRYQYNKVHYQIQIKDIIFFQSDKRLTYIITNSGEKKCYSKLNDIEKKLKETNIVFLRTHQSYLVNPEYISRYRYDSLYLTNGYTISISIKRRKLVNYQYCSYMGEKIIG